VLRISICIIFGSQIRINIHIKSHIWIPIRIIVKFVSCLGSEVKMETRRLKIMAHNRALEGLNLKPVVAEPHHFDEESDPHQRKNSDPVPHQSEKPDPHPQQSDEGPQHGDAGPQQGDAGPQHGDALSATR
jgi:hypothetical protein